MIGRCEFWRAENHRYLEKDRGKLPLSHQEEIDVGVKKKRHTGGNAPSLPLDQIEKRKELTLLSGTEIECPNYRFSISGPDGELSVPHLSKLEFQDGDMIGQVCNNGVYIAGNGSRRKVLVGETRSPQR